MKNIMRRAGHWLKGAFTKNIGLKIGALVFAFLLWSFVIAEQNPIREKTFQNIPVTFVGVDTLRQRDLTSTEPFSELLSTANVTVEANAERISLITDGMLSVEVDLSSVTDVGEKTLPVKAKSTMAGINMDVSPKEVTVNIESIVTQDVPVEVQLTGERKSWLYYGEPVLSENAIEVTGARSNVEQVAKAVCYIDIDQLESYNKETRSVVLLDNNGDELPSNMFTGIPSVIVELPIYPKESVAVDIKNIEETTTGIADGYEIAGITVDPSSVDIAGNLEDISQITAVKLEPIALENATGDQVVNAKVMLQDGIYAASPSEVQVQLSIMPVQESRTYPAVGIEVKNLGENLKAALRPETVDVDVNGAKTVLDSFSVDMLKPFVDLQDLEKGTYTVELKFENAPDLGVNIVPSIGAVSVTIS